VRFRPGSEPGARTSLNIATAPESEATNGRPLDDRAEKASSAQGDEFAAARLQ
jgi:hypothetical protein